MRVAFVQGGEGLDPIESQLALLKPLSPDRYLIEERPTTQGRQRLIELLEVLGEGDEFCFSCLAALGLSVGEALQLFVDLMARGVTPRSLADAERLDEARLASAREVLQPFADLHRRSATASSRPGETDRALLGPDEIEDIRRLSRAGLSPRRIGLIYRRSPKCIGEILRHGAPPLAEGALSVRA